MVDYRSHGLDPEEMTDRGRKRIIAAGIIMILINAVLCGAARSLHSLVSMVEELDGSLLNVSALVSLAGVAAGVCMIVFKKKSRLIYLGALVCGVAAVMSLVYGALPMRYLDSDVWVPRDGDFALTILYSVLAEYGSKMIMTVLIILLNIYVWPCVLAGNQLWRREVDLFIEQESDTFSEENNL